MSVLIYDASTESALRLGEAFGALCHLIGDLNHSNETSMFAEYLRALSEEHAWAKSTLDRAVDFVSQWKHFHENAGNYAECKKRLGPCPNVLSALLSVFTAISKCPIEELTSEVVKFQASLEAVWAGYATMDADWNVWTYDPAATKASELVHASPPRRSIGTAGIGNSRLGRSGS